MPSRVIATFFAFILSVSSAASDTLWCDSYPFDALPPLQAPLLDLAPALEHFPSFKETLTNRVSAICLADGLLDAQGYFEPETGNLVLNAALTSGMTQAIIIHELRHAQQFSLDVCPTVMLSMQNYARAVFAMEADASVASLVIAQFLSDNGDTAMMEALSTWPMQSDIAERFQQSVQNGEVLNQAAAVAFDQWYASEIRRETYYVATCLDYLDRSEQEDRLPRYESIAPTFFGELCHLPDGHPYPCAERKPFIR